MHTSASFCFATPPIQAVPPGVILFWVALPHRGSVPQAQEARGKAVFQEAVCHDSSMCTHPFLVASQHSLFRLCHPLPFVWIILNGCHFHGVGACRRHKKPVGTQSFGGQHAMKIPCANICFLLLRNTPIQAVPPCATQHRHRLCHPAP